MKSIAAWWGAHREAVVAQLWDWLAIALAMLIVMTALVGAVVLYYLFGWLGLVLAVMALGALV